MVFGGQCLCNGCSEKLEKPVHCLRLAFSNARAFQASPNNRFTNTALRKPCFRTGCEIAWSFRGAARYQGLVPTLSDTMLSLGTSELNVKISTRNSYTFVDRLTCTIIDIKKDVPTALAWMCCSCPPWIGNSLISIEDRQPQHTVVEVVAGERFFCL